LGEHGSRLAPGEGPSPGLVLVEDDAAAAVAEEREDLGVSRVPDENYLPARPGKAVDQLLDPRDDGAGRVHDLDLLPEEAPAHLRRDPVTADDDRPPADVRRRGDGTHAPPFEVGDHPGVVDEVPERRHGAAPRAAGPPDDVQGSSDPVTESRVLGDDDFHSSANLRIVLYTIRDHPLCQL
jgi:hypothetical protein